MNVDLPAGRMVVLTGPGVAPIAVSGGDLKPGLTAELSLTFANGSSRTIQVPVADAADPIFSSVTPLPTGSPTPACLPDGDRLADRVPEPHDDAVAGVRTPRNAAGDRGVFVVSGA